MLVVTKEIETMRGIGIGTVLGIIGVIYVIGLAIHFWWLIVAILLAIYGHDLIVKSKTRRAGGPARTEPPNPSQAYYSNRR